MVIKPDGSIRTAGWYSHKQAEYLTKFRSTTVAPKPFKKRKEILAAVRATSERHVQNRSLSAVNLSARAWHILFQALIEAESQYNPTAMSPKGAYGLGQIMPATAQNLGIDRTDPAQNLEGAARYFLMQLDAFQNIELALAAYNAGPQRVMQYGGVPPFKETRNYIARIQRIRTRLSGQPRERHQNRISAGQVRRTPVVIDLH